MTQPKQRRPDKIEYTGITQLMYSLEDTAAKFGMAPKTLYLLAETHPVYKAQARHNGLKRAVYTNHQVAAIKQVLLGNIEPDDALAAFRKADKNEAWALYHELAYGAPDEKEKQ